MLAQQNRDLLFQYQSQKHIEKTVCLPGMKRFDIEAARIVVYAFLNEPERGLSGIQADGDWSHGTRAGQFHADHFR